MFPVRSAAIQKIRNRSDMAESMFITDDEIIDLANDQLELAYHACVSAYGDSAFAQEQVILNLSAGAPETATTWPTSNALTAAIPHSVAAIQTRYPLNPGFGRLLRAEWTTGSIAINAGFRGAYFTTAGYECRWYPMHPVDLQGMVYSSTPVDWAQGSVGYWITAHPGETLPMELDPADTMTQFWISFLPVPKTNVSVHLQYVPQAPQWGNDDSGYIRLPDLAWKFVRESTAADILEKQRSDSTQLRANAAQYLADLTGAKLHPDYANPPMTVDVYGNGNGRDIW